MNRILHIEKHGQQTITIWAQPQSKEYGYVGYGKFTVGNKAFVFMADAREYVKKI